MFEKQSRVQGHAREKIVAFRAHSCQVTLLPVFRKKAPRDIYSRGLLGVMIL